MDYPVRDHRRSWQGAFLRTALFLAAALAMRGATLGDPTLAHDEEFYVLVGQRMVHGALPYVDIWDRKPPGLFFLYALIERISASPLSYQLAALGFVVASAEAIFRIARLHGMPRGGIVAGCVYIIYLNCLGGYGGQASVFYNLFVAWAALLTFSALPRLRAGQFPASLGWAMLLLGIGITIKQTVIAEAAYFGLLAAITSRSWRIAAVSMALGALPFALVSIPFLAHWEVFWQAMVTSNLTKRYTFDGAIWVLVSTTRMLIPLITGALAALVLSRRWALGGWILAATAGFFLVPRFYPHYAIPLLVPLCAAAAALFERRLIGIAAAVVICGYNFLFQWPFDRAYHREAAAALSSFAQPIAASGARTMLVYDGPSALYSATGLAPLSRIVFPFHWNQAIEADTWGGSTRAEFARVLAAGPDIVVLPQTRRNNPENLATRAMLNAYLRRCRLFERGELLEAHRRDMIEAWDCRARPVPSAGLTIAPRL